MEKLTDDGARDRQFQRDPPLGGHALQQWPNGRSLWQDVELTGTTTGFPGQETLFPPADTACQDADSNVGPGDHERTDTSLSPKTFIPPP